MSAEGCQPYSAHSKTRIWEFFYEFLFNFYQCLLNFQIQVEYSPIMLVTKKKSKYEITLHLLCSAPRLKSRTAFTPPACRILGKKRQEQRMAAKDNHPPAIVCPADAPYDATVGSFLPTQ
jgi:hypothetical protein